MKIRIIALTALTAIMLALFAGCGEVVAPTADTTKAELKYVDVDISKLAIDLDALVATVKAEVKFDDVDLFPLDDSMVSVAYKVSGADVAAVASTGSTAECILMLKTESEADAKAAADTLRDYCTSMSKVYASYNAVEAAKLTKAFVTSNGNYAFMCVSPDSAKAQSVFESYIVSLAK